MSEETKMIALGGTILGNMQMTATLSTRVNNGLPFLVGAARFSRSVKEIQDTNTANLGEHWEEIRDNAVACVFLIVAALESYTHEMFSDRDKIFPNQNKRVLERFWKAFERKSTLEKFNLTLILRDKEEMGEKSLLR